MKQLNSEEQLRWNIARKKAKEIRDFYYHLSCYCIIIPVLIVINITFFPEFYWVFFTIGGWGTGLFFHWIAAFGYNPFLGKNWEELKLREFMEEEKQRQNNYNH